MYVAIGFFHIADKKLRVKGKFTNMFLGENGCLSKSTLWQYPPLRCLPSLNPSLCSTTPKFPDLTILEKILLTQTIAFILQITSRSQCKWIFLHLLH